jgi:hypothetical protein
MCKTFLHSIVLGFNFVYLNHGVTLSYTELYTELDYYVNDKPCNSVQTLCNSVV